MEHNQEVHRVFKKAQETKFKLDQCNSFYYSGISSKMVWKCVDLQSRRSKQWVVATVIFLGQHTAEMNSFKFPLLDIVLLLSLALG